MIEITEEYLVMAGLDMVSNWGLDTICETDNLTNLGRMKNFFFASPKTLKTMFEAIQESHLGENQICCPNLKDFLCAFYFLKKYPTKTDLAAIKFQLQDISLFYDGFFITFLLRISEFGK